MPEPIIQYPPGNDSLYDLPSNITDIILSLKEKKRVKSPVICTKSSKKKENKKQKIHGSPEILSLSPMIISLIC